MILYPSIHLVKYVKVKVSDVLPNSYASKIMQVLAVKSVVEVTSLKAYIYNFVLGFLTQREY